MHGLLKVDSKTMQGVGNDYARIVHGLCSDYVMTYFDGQCNMRTKDFRQTYDRKICE